MATRSTVGFRIATEPFLFLDHISVAVATSLTPQLIVAKLCHSYYNATVCSELSTGLHPDEEKAVYDEASNWNSLIFLAQCIPALATVLIVGAFADLVSKKKLLLIPPLLNSLAAVILILSAKFTSSSLIFTVFSWVLPGLFGGIHGSAMLAFFYVADATEATPMRTVRMNILEGMMCLSLGVGSFVSGILLQYYGFVIAYSLSLSASITNFMFVAFFLPDGMNQEISTGKEKDPRGILSSLCENLKRSCINIVVFLKKYLLGHRHVVLIFLVTLFTRWAFTGQKAITVLFLKHMPLSLSSREVGEFLLVFESTRGVGVIIMAMISLKIPNVSDVCKVLIGQLSMISTYIGISLSKSLQTLFGTTPLIIAAPFATSGVRAMLSKMVQPDESGTALSCLEFVSLIAFVLATISSNQVFRLTAEVFPGTVFLMLAFLCSVGFVFTVAIMCSIRGNTGDTSHEVYTHKTEEAVALLDAANYQK